MQVGKIRDQVTGEATTNGTLAPRVVKAGKKGAQAEIISKD
jgi:hypothetical protein